MSTGAISFRVFVAAGLVCLPMFAQAQPAVQSGVSVLCVEAESGLVVFEHDAEIVRPPASMVKLMLMLMVAEGLRDEAWRLDQEIVVTPFAESIGGSQVYLRGGEVQSLGNLMFAVAVKSANDAATAVAEGLWGSVAGYLEAMNARAQELGMSRSKFHSPHGLPPSAGQPFDETTARDMAILARMCVNEPMVRNWVSTKEHQFRAKDPPLYNTNKLLWRMEGCDGLKTGYIRAAGFCVAATASREDVRLITIVMGHPSNYARFNLAEAVFEYGFGQVRREQVLTKATPGPLVAVVNGSVQEVALAVDEDVWLNLPADALERIVVTHDAPRTITAPVEAGTRVGLARVELDGQVLETVNLVAPASIEAAGWMTRIQSRIKRFVEPKSPTISALGDD